MVIRNCLKLLTELSGLELIIKEEELRLKELGIDIDLNELLLTKLNQNNNKQGM